MRWLKIKMIVMYFLTCLLLVTKIVNTSITSINTFFFFLFENECIHKLLKII